MKCTINEETKPNDFQGSKRKKMKLLLTFLATALEGNLLRSNAFRIFRKWSLTCSFLFSYWWIINVKCKELKHLSQVSLQEKGLGRPNRAHITVLESWVQAPNLHLCGVGGPGKHLEWWSSATEVTSAPLPPNFCLCLLSSHPPHPPKEKMRYVIL